MTAVQNISELRKHRWECELIYFRDAKRSKEGALASKDVRYMPTVSQMYIQNPPESSLAMVDPSIGERNGNDVGMK